MTNKQLDAFARRMEKSPLGAGICVLFSPILFYVVSHWHDGPAWLQVFLATAFASLYLIPGMIIWVCWHANYDPNDTELSKYADENP
jgi:hypothetical protein